MSINVNVRGNPISINRGKLVNGDPDYAKNEFDKRRRMRLEQVRQQSKDIAENVRNKVRKEKRRQLSDFEKREEAKLKQWQNRKLLELQQQYRESIKDIGLAHAQAEVENTQDAVEHEYREHQKEKARERGQRAVQKAQADRNTQNIKKAIPVQQKKLTRDIENARSAMVAKNSRSPSKKRKKRKSKTNINITTNLSSDTVSPSELEELNLGSDNWDSTLSEMEESGARRKRSKSRSPMSSSAGDSKISSLSERFRENSPRQSVSPKRPKSPLETIPEPVRPTYFPIDTRISDRIKSRRYFLETQPSLDPYHKADNKLTLHSQQRAISPSEIRSTVDKTTSTMEQVPTIICNCTCQAKKPSMVDVKVQNNEIPVKPTVSLKSVTKSMKDDVPSGSKVQYYDHSTRFSKEYIGSKSMVKKIPNEEIEECCCLCPCADRKYLERAYKYDGDAEVRGKRAMDKLNIHRDYQEMLKQLPTLQKQERLATLSGDKQIFHMSDDRFKEYRKNKENEMDNVYERHFPKTITIPPKKHVIEEEPFRTINVADGAPTRDNAQWDEDKKDENGFTLTKDCGNIIIETDANSTNKEDYLKYLLERLKVQKEMLLREAASLPENSNLNNIISELESLRTRSLGDEKAGPSDQCVCPLPDSTNGEDTRTDDRKSTKNKRSRQIVVSTSSSSTSSTPTKKRKQKRFKIVLQNHSTQTSPKIISDDKENDICIPLTCKEKRLARKHTSKKGSVSPPKNEGIVKTSRPTSPIKILSEAKDQACSPIIVETTKKKSKLPTQVEQQSLKCKCNLTETQEKECTCRCYMPGGGEDLCEILIKIKDNEEPEIRIKSPTKQIKNVQLKDVSDKTSSNFQSALKSKAKTQTKRVVKIDANVSKTSWREQFTRNDVAAGTSTSTSYFSPPDYTKSDFSRFPQAESTGTRPSYNSSDMTSKSGQSRRKIDPRLLTYIKKLLTMSRSSIDDLAVSSVSDVSTPSVSMMNNAKGGSLNQLRNVIKYFNIDPGDLAYYLNYSDDTGGNSATPSSGLSSGYDASKSNANNFTAASSTSDRSKMQQSREFLPSPVEDVNSTPVSQYADLAELCQKRISELAAMIEQVRMEKQQILSPAQSDKENSTQYMGLPSQLNEKSQEMEAQDASSEFEQAEIDRKMLEIDFNLAERLKTQTQQQDSPVGDSDGFDKDLVERYRRLISVDEQISEDENVQKKGMLVRSVEVEGDQLQVQENIRLERVSGTTRDLATPFTSILGDIPRLPKLDCNQESPKVQFKDLQIETQKRPPPAKGLIAAKKFNMEITGQPHELSTIVEVDSQLSTRIRPSYSPKRPSPLTSPTRAFEYVNPVIILPEFPTDWVDRRKDAIADGKDAKEKEPDKKPSDGSMPDIVAEIGEDASKKEKGVQVANKPNKTTHEVSSETSSDKSELENIETMLKSMGMDWAISTIRKTRAAQNRASSSASNSESGLKEEYKSSPSLEENEKRPINSSETSDVTLRDILGQKLFSNSTSSSLTRSLSPHLRGLHELSSIHGSGTRSAENKQQRTSTPIQTTKSSESKKEGVFTGESEVSSVKLSDDYVTMRDTTGNDTD
ncbi:putative zinc finger protein 704 [Trypoxylus dichotomus]